MKLGRGVILFAYPYMHLAIEQAKKAKATDEVPVGAVIVKNDAIVSIAYNKRNTSKQALYHAEIIAINDACEKLGRWQLDDCVRRRCRPFHL